MSGNLWMGGPSESALVEPTLVPTTTAVIEIAGVGFSLTAQATILLLLAGIVTWAAISDLLRGTIPNAANTAMFVLWVAWVISGAETSVGYSFLIGAGVFAFGAVLFQFGQMGGGDVKMLTALAIWAGPPEILVFLIQVAFAGGVLTMAWLTHMRFVAPAMGRMPANDAERFVPYGVAIAAGTYLMIARLWTG